MATEKQTVCELGGPRRAAVESALTASRRCAQIASGLYAFTPPGSTSTPIGGDGRLIAQPCHLCRKHADYYAAYFWKRINCECHPLWDGVRD